MTIARSRSIPESVVFKSLPGAELRRRTTARSLAAENQTYPPVHRARPTPTPLGISTDDACDSKVAGFIDQSLFSGIGLHSELAIQYGKTVSPYMQRFATYKSVDSGGWRIAPVLRILALVLWQEVLMKKVALLMVIAISVSSYAQTTRRKEKRESGEGGARSFVQLFTRLERDWTTAIQKHDTAALDKLLAPEFIVRTTADPERVINRSDWLEKIVPTYKIDSFSQSGMTVRVFHGDIALVSFVQSQKATVNNSHENGKFLVVDVWIANRASSQWQPAQRYWAAIRGRP